MTLEALTVDGVTKAFGTRQVLAGVDLSVGAGEIAALLGRNGAGKTTLLSIVVGLADADAGRVEILRCDVRADPGSARRHLGFAAQEVGVYPVISARRNLEFFGQVLGLRGRALDARVERVLDALALTALADTDVRFLSGGEQRRVHVAAALLRPVGLLVLDEPTTGVDVHTRRKLLDLLRGLATDEGVAICYSTHYLPEIQDLGASVAILHNGAIAVRGEPAEVTRLAGRRDRVELSFSKAVSLPSALNPMVIDDRTRASIEVDDVGPALVAVIGLIPSEAANYLEGISVSRPDLESIFVSVTGAPLGADEEPVVEQEARP